MTRPKLLALAALTLAMSVPALAHLGRPEGGPEGATPGLGSGGPRRGGRSSDLLRRLVFPCPGDCREAARVCGETADSEALACIGDACSTEIEAARAACADDVRADSCRTALGSLRECGASCFETRATALGECRSALEECVAACDAEE